jgi:hypothetical protein
MTELVREASNWAFQLDVQESKTERPIITRGVARDFSRAAWRSPCCPCTLAATAGDRKSQLVGSSASATGRLF